MGIQDLYNVMPKDCLEAKSLKEFANQSCVIDISIFLYKTIRSCGIGWINQFIYLISVLRKNNIDLVCIFDGPNPPPEKKREQLRRRDQVSKQIEKLQRSQELKSLIEDKWILDPMYVIPDEIIKECQDLTKKFYTNPQGVITELESTITKLTNQTIPITNDYKEKAKQILEILDVKIVQADGEAEALCASMVRDGFVDFVLTEDTDVLAYGARRMCAFKKFKFSDEMVYEINLDKVLLSLNMTFPSFLDLCILLSCDYNDRVKGWVPTLQKQKKPIAIGAKHAVSMIEEYGTLDVAKEYLEDPEPLIYERCREIFSGVDYDTTMIPSQTPPNPNYDLLESFLEENYSTMSIEFISRCFGSNIRRKGVL